MTFLVCCLIVIVWAASDPFFGFSDTWQLVINTGTTIVTFLMVFLIQNTQNRDGAAIQAKLDELIRASASQNAFIGIEHLTQAEVEEFRVKCAEHAAAATAGDGGYPGGRSGKSCGGSHRFRIVALFSVGNCPADAVRLA